MKTKLTFLSVAIVALLGVGMLMAFKQERTSEPKKFVSIMLVQGKSFSMRMVIIDENSQVNEKELKPSNSNENDIENQKTINQQMNLLGEKGYNLVSHEGYIYIFSKD